MREIDIEDKRGKKERENKEDGRKERKERQNKEVRRYKGRIRRMW